MTEPNRVSKGGERYYSVGGEEYPSVTTILNAYQPKKKKIDNWRARLKAEGKDPNAVRDRAALRGTIAHHRILNQYAVRELPPPKVDINEIDEDLMTDVETCVALWNDLDFEVGPSPHVEESVWSHEHGYAGTLDLLTGGDVVDLKTSKAAFNSHKMQAAAYFHAAEELPRLPDPTGAAIIVLHPDEDNLTGKVVRMDRDEIAHWFGVFLDVLDTFNAQSKII